MKGSTPNDLFTKDQHDYVNRVKDEDLRYHLLYQVRLRDNMEKDRDAFERLLNSKLQAQRK